MERIVLQSKHMVSFNGPDVISLSNEQPAYKIVILPLFFLALLLLSHVC